MISDVQLRDVRESDLPTFFAHQMDAVAHRMAGFTPRDREAFMAHWAKILIDDTVAKKTIVCDGRITGHVVCFERLGLREVGYWIGQESWGKGIATRALSEFLRQERLRPLYARVATHNVASIRVLEKCGFATASADSHEAGAAGDGVDEVILVLDATTQAKRPAG